MRWSIPSCILVSLQLDPEMEVKWAWILLKDAICMLLLASQSPFSTFAFHTREDRSKLEERIFGKYFLTWIFAILPFFLQ